MKRTLTTALALLAAVLLATTALSAVRTGNDQDNRIVGTPRNDDLRGYGGDDLLIGRPGNDLLVGGPGRDTLRGGRGEDLADYRHALEGVAADLRRGIAIAGKRDKLKSIESLAGGPGGDRLRGDRRQNFIDGVGGNDLLVSRGGKDTIAAFEGKDRVRAGAGRDFVLSNGGQLTRVDCGRGRDTVSADRRDRLRRCERKHF